MPTLSPSASAAASSAKRFRFSRESCGLRSGSPVFRRVQTPAVSRLVERALLTNHALAATTGWTEHPAAVWLKALARYPQCVEIPLTRDAPALVDNGECVGSYQVLGPHAVAARVAMDASCLSTGIYLR